MKTQSVYKRKNFLPVSRKDLIERGWDQPDIIVVTGDAYVDHPSFGAAVIGRWLESLGFKVAVLSQPGWKSAEDFKAIGRPRLFWAITSGSIDSRLNNYTSFGHKRKNDVYSPAGKTGRRPDKPVLTYCARAREAYKDAAIVIGGLEASLRRMVHYDYVEDKIKKSILTDAKADILVHGMGELAVGEIAEKINAGCSKEELAGIQGTAYNLKKNVPYPEKFFELPSYEQILSDSSLFMQAHLEYQKRCCPDGDAVVQDQGAGKIAIMPPSRPLSEAEMDRLYSLPFTRQTHPDFRKEGEVPALEPVKFSLTTHRGCFGGCSFCSIYFHQGKQISSRSQNSIIKELEELSKRKDFKGTVQDIGGPTANMYAMKCLKKTPCSRQSCIYPNICKHLDHSHDKLISLMKFIVKWKKAVKGRNAFVASGVRYDLAVKSDEYIRLLCREFVGGHLKVAPEHFSNNTLKYMGKPKFGLFEKFENKFNEESRKAGREQYLVPYFISSHPGCTNQDAEELTEYLVSKNIMPRQVQDFTPSPLSLSTAMYVSGVDKNFNQIYTARGTSAKKIQFALLRYYEPKNFSLLSKHLSKKQKFRLLEQIRKKVNYQKKRKR
ncbi:YgiQ family radical SAM protein [Sedimentisphaera salicampi]|uniref:YgiQ family radical SAM protein n=1 Tax=Sedimentisphaera salicampi TaxID=1941349 RepID=UPI0021BCC893|nr:YgiQ family radical SAM protein [Sedimentisphaera salicampi]